jgi:hypothetical protein
LIYVRWESLLGGLLRRGGGEKIRQCVFFSLVNRRGVAAPGVMFPRDVLDDFKIVAAGKDFIGRKRVFTRL